MPAVFAVFRRTDVVGSHVPVNDAGRAATGDDGARKRRSGPWLEARVRARAGQVVVGVAALLAALAFYRPLASNQIGQRWWLAYVLLLGMGMAVAALLAGLKGRTPWALPAFYAFLALCVDGLGQISAPHGWPVWPLMVVLIGTLTIAEPRTTALAVAALASTLEAAAAGASAAPHPWPAALAASLGYFAVVFAFDRALLGEKRRLAAVRAELARVQLGIDSLGEQVPAEERTNPMARALHQVSEGGRRARHIDQAKDLDQSLQSVVELAKAALGVHAVLYFDLDHDREVAYVRAAAGPDRLLPHCVIPFTQDPIAFVVDRRRSFYATDFKRLLWRLPYYRGELRVGSLLALPVRQGEAIIGVLVADRLEIQRFTEDEPDLLKGFAALAAETVQRHRAARSRDEQTLEFKALSEVLQRLKALESPAKVRQLLLNSAQGLVAPQAAAVVSSDGERYVVEAACGWATEFEGREVSLSERTWTAWVLQSAREAYRLDNAADHKMRMPLLVLDEGGEPAGSLLVLPLSVTLTERRKLLGAFVLAGSHGTFSAAAHRVLEIFANQAALALFAFQQIEDERRRALQDGLTGLYNRRAFDDAYRRQLAQQQRKGGTLGILLMDIDHFKKLNDTYGHPAGDAALRNAASTLRRVLRRGDIAARYGGEEFVVILPDTDEGGARQLAERARSAIARGQVIFEGQRITMTASFGLALWPGDGREAAELLGATDRALYAAKEQGRNRVILASSLPKEAPAKEAAAAPASDGPANQG